MLSTLLRMAALEASRTGISMNVPAVSDLLVGAWDWDVVNDLVYADAQFASMFGIAANEAARGLPVSYWIAAIHPDDRQRVVIALEAASATGCFSAQYRVGHGMMTRWLYARGVATFSDAGHLVRLPGAVIDVTNDVVHDPVSSRSA
jgi:PAS domain-containing protein